MLYNFCSPKKPRTASRTFYALVIFLLLGVPVSLQATAKPPQAAGSPLLSVDLAGSARFHTDQIVAAAGLHPGANINRDDLQAAADRLAKLGTFASVQYRYSTVGAGVKVTFEVTDAPEIPIAFDNIIPWFNDEELTAALKNSVPLFDGNVPEHGSMLDDISAAIQKLLDTRNVHARVSHSVSYVGAANQKVQLFSTAGGGLNIGAIEFPDVLAKTDRGLQERTSDLLGQPFSRSSIEVFELEQVRPVYLAHGFLQLKFGQPGVRFPTDAKDSNTNKVTVTIPVEPGTAYSWNGVTWKGNYSVPSEALDELLKLQTGDVADGMKIQAGIEATRGLYAERGYLDAKIDAAPKYDDASKRVSYAITIDEGPQYHMGNLVLTGLSLDGEKRIRGAWKMAPGSIFDKNVFDQFVDTGIKQAFAGSPFRYEKIGRFLQQNPQEAKVDVMLDFQ
jgi:outer membrane protein assembly factor BamA